MTQTPDLSGAIRRIALGYLFLLFNLNAGGVNLLPEWVGYLWIALQIDAVGQVRPSIRLLKSLSLGLAAWDVFYRFSAGFLGYFIRIPALIAGAVSLYFLFQLLTDLASLAEPHLPALGKRIRDLRTAQTLYFTLLHLVLPDFSTDNSLLILLAALIPVGLLVWTVASLFDLSASLEKPSPETPS